MTDPGKKVTAADLIASASAQASPFDTIRERIAHTRTRYTPSVYSPEIYLYSAENDKRALQTLHDKLESAEKIHETSLKPTPNLQDICQNHTVTLYCELNDKPPHPEPPLSDEDTQHRDALRKASAEEFTGLMQKYFTDIVGVPEDAIRYHLQVFTKDDNPHGSLLIISMPHTLREAGERFAIDMAHPPEEYLRGR